MSDKNTIEDNADNATEEQNSENISAEKLQSMAESLQKLNQAIDELGDSEEAEAMRAEVASAMNIGEQNHSHEAGNNASKSMLGPNPMVGLHGKDFVSVATQMTKSAITQPIKTLTGLARLSRDVVQAIKGESDIAPKKGDRRFADSAWETNPIYKRVMQSYLAWSTQLQELSGELMDSDEDKKRASFMLSLLTDAAAPTNTLINPAALKRVIETGGSSLVQGTEHLIHDIKYNGAMPSQVDTTAFEVGKNLACTKGSVVFRNDLVELIQYAPTTDKVHKRPLLFIPPQINKYYVLDLSPEKSLMKFLVEHSFQTFAISWRNPTLRHRDVGLGSYVESAIEAIDAVREITGETVNIMGACSGGITAAVTMAHLEALKQREEKINSLTLLVSMLDTQSDTELSLFTTEDSIEASKQRSHTKGYVDSSEMARSFAWLRPNDLIWNYWVNNYLLGNTPPVFDILYWNADGTRMSAALHADYIDIFAQNALISHDNLVVNDTVIDLASISCDYYTLAGTTDHITPWKTCYKSHNLLGGKGEFVLSNSGHVQSLVNPPTNPKASFFTNKKNPATADEWKEGAEPQAGSWWLHWTKWLGKQSAAKITAPKSVGSKKHPALCDAPGQYIYE